MSDEIERRLRAAGHRLPAPTDADTLSARRRFIGSFTPRRRLGGRPAVFALAATLAVGGAFGVGYGVAAGKTETKTKVVVVKPRLQAGPGFLPAEGWSTAVALDPQSGSIVQATASSASGTRIVAKFAPASAHPGLPRGLLPLHLPDGGRVRSVVAHAGAYAITATITFGSAAPAPAALVAAREELGRLVVPACPAARRLTDADVAAAKAFVLRWLPAHYSGDASDVVGATATAHAGVGMPRHGEAAADCGADVAARSIEVDVVLPKLAQVSASLSQLTYFVAKTDAGFAVWERAR